MVNAHATGRVNRARHTCDIYKSLRIKDPCRVRIIGRRLPVGLRITVIAQSARVGVQRLVG